MNRLLLVCVFLAAATAAVMGQDPYCPASYTLRPGGNCYKLWTEQAKWYYAEHTCIAEGGLLASIRNDDDSVWINNFFADNRRHLCGDWYWVGGNDLAQESVWRWLDGSQFTYTNWMPGQPNNLDGYEHVVTVHSKDRKWNDTLGTYHKKCFVCERKPIGSPDC